MAVMARLSGKHSVWLAAGLLVLCSEGSPPASYLRAHASERSIATRGVPFFPVYPQDWAVLLLVSKTLLLV